MTWLGRYCSTWFVSTNGYLSRSDIEARRPQADEAEKIPDKGLNQIQGQERVVDFGPLLRKVYDRYRKTEFWISWIVTVTTSGYIFNRYMIITTL